MTGETADLIQASITRAIEEKKPFKWSIPWIQIQGLSGMTGDSPP